jgi:cell wall-associated NlpC family hydrolase
MPVTEAVAAKRTFGSRPLARPMKGRDVRVLQDFLTRLGLRTSVDGAFGAGTERRVRLWERRSGRRVDGRVSLADAAVLRAAVEGSVQAPEPTPAPAPTVTPAAAPLGPGDKATIGPDGAAVAPASAPAAVQAIIAAGNAIRGLPYKYGGGHGRWDDTGYDCSGSVSYALHAAALLKSPLDSSSFMSWGEAGPGQWVTIYTNPGHAYMIVAGLRFDTSGMDDGSRWDARARSASGYTVRHPPGL